MISKVKKRWINYDYIYILNIIQVEISSIFSVFCGSHKLPFNGHINTPVSILH